MVFWIFLASLASNVSGAEMSTGEKSGYSTYAGSESCRDCHRSEYELWKSSHHALAERPLQMAGSASTTTNVLRTAEVEAAFHPSRSVKNGTDTTIIRTNGSHFEIVTLGLESNRQPFRVERGIGCDPLIQFLTPFPGGRYQVHEASYDPKSNQWFYVYGDDFRNPGEFGHWTGRGMNWNSSCAECHNTRLHKNYDPTTDNYHTTMAEMAVGCEACHGPLKAHNDWQKAHSKTTSPDPTVSKLTPARLLGLCGSCHSRTTDLTENFMPGDSFYDHYSLEILDHAERWYPDGQVKDEDYEFTSFLSSKMYQDGVTCLDCHNPHSYKNNLAGNDLCLRCHNGGFPKAPKIDPAAHGHHKLTDHGSDCIGCHMPVTVYMQRHPRRDHGFTIPDPLLTKTLGIPNACNRCHAGQSTDWALKFTEEWYGTNMNRGTRNRAQWIASAEGGEPGALDKILGLLNDTNQSPYWRAVAAALLDQWADEEGVKIRLIALTHDEHPLVREKAVRTLESALDDTNVQAMLRQRLDDPVRNVRVAAAWALRAAVDMNSRAGRDLQQTLDLESDQPTGQFKQAIFLLARQQPAEALIHLQKAVAWDPISPPFLCTLAQIQDQMGQFDEALKTLDQAKAAAPDDPHISYVRVMILKRHGR